MPVCVGMRVSEYCGVRETHTQIPRTWQRDRKRAPGDTHHAQARPQIHENKHKPQSHKAKQAKKLQTNYHRRRKAKERESAKKNLEAFA